MFLSEEINGKTITAHIDMCGSPCLPGGLMPFGWGVAYTGPGIEPLASRLPGAT